MPGYNIMLEALPLGGGLGTLISMPYADLRLLKSKEAADAHNRVIRTYSRSSRVRYGANGYWYSNPAEGSMSILIGGHVMTSGFNLSNMHEVIRAWNDINLGPIPEVENFMYTDYAAPGSGIDRSAVRRQDFIIDTDPMLSEAELITIETAKGEVWLQLIKMPFYKSKGDYSLAICYQRNIAHTYQEGIIISNGYEEDMTLKMDHSDSRIYVLQSRLDNLRSKASNSAYLIPGNKVPEVIERLRRFGDSINHKLRGITRGEVLTRLEPILLT